MTCGAPWTSRQTEPKQQPGASRPARLREYSRWQDTVFNWSESSRLRGMHSRAGGPVLSFPPPGSRPSTLVGVQQGRKTMQSLVPSGGPSPQTLSEADAATRGDVSDASLTDPRGVQSEGYDVRESSTPVRQSGRSWFAVGQRSLNGECGRQPFDSEHRTAIKDGRPGGETSSKPQRWRTILIAYWSQPDDRRRGRDRSTRMGGRSRCLRERVCDRAARQELRLPAGTPIFRSAICLPRP